MLCDFGAVGYAQQRLCVLTASTSYLHSVLTFINLSFYLCHFSHLCTFRCKLLSQLNRFYTKYQLDIFSLKALNYYLKLGLSADGSDQMIIRIILYFLKRNPKMQRIQRNQARATHKILVQIKVRINKKAKKNIHFKINSYSTFT